MEASEVLLWGRRSGTETTFHHDWFVWKFGGSAGSSEVPVHAMRSDDSAEDDHDHQEHDHSHDAGDRPCQFLRRPVSSMAISPPNSSSMRTGLIETDNDVASVFPICKHIDG